MSSRHNTYFELRDALGAPGCVVCRLSARSVRRYLEALAFESVNDLGLRAQLRRSRGFCNQHAWQMLEEAREPYGAGIIYRDVLNACISDPGSSGECIACEAREASARRYVDALVDHAHEPEIAHRIAHGGGICWRHFALAVSRGGRGLRALARAELGALERVADPTWRPDRAVAAAATAGIRAGNAAPRRAADEQVSEPLVAVVLGLRPSGAASPEWDECSVCDAARAVVEGAVTSVADSGALPPRPRGAFPPARPGADEGSALALPPRAPPLDPAGAGEAQALCARHAWLAVDRGGAAAVRAALAPAHRRFQERLAAAADDLAKAESVGFGPLAFSTPGARRARAELAQRLAPPAGCSICDAQRAAEDAAQVPSDAVLCRPHLRTPNQATLSHWRALLADLDEYVRKSDYRFRDEPRGEEQRAPWRAVAAVAGGPGLR